MYHFNLAELIRAGSLGELLAIFQRSTGLVVKGVGHKGQTLIESGEQKEATYCTLINNSPEGQRRCRTTYARAGREASKFNGPYLFRCHAGLLGWALTVSLDAGVSLTVVCGQAHLSPPDHEFPALVASLAGELALKEEDLRTAAGQLPVISPQKAQAGVEMLYLMANYLARGRGERLLERTDDYHSPPRVALMVREQELLHHVRACDQSGARAVLQSLLNDLRRDDIDLDRVRSRVIEIIVLLTRAAADRPGEDLSRILNLNAELIRLASQARDNALWQLPWQALEALCPGFPNDVAGPVLGRAFHYIYQNYTRPGLTLEAIAREAYVSPSYLSHLFRRTMGESVMTYLTRLRIEMAKKLLREGNLSISDVGRKVGYPNPGYFTRVFKRVVQITPRDYLEQYRGSKKQDSDI